MKNSENFGSVRSAARIAGFVIDVIRHSSMAWLVVPRNSAPPRHPSPKNWPSPKIPTTASLPCSDKTVILTFPIRMKKTVSATSPWLKIFWFFPYVSIVFPAPIRRRNPLGSNASFSRICDVFRMVLFRHEAGAQHLVTGQREGGTVMRQIFPLCAVDDINRVGNTTQLVVSLQKQIAHGLRGAC